MRHNSPFSTPTKKASSPCRSRRSSGKAKFTLLRVLDIERRAQREMTCQNSRANHRIGRVLFFPLDFDDKDLGRKLAPRTPEAKNDENSHNHTSNSHNNNDYAYRFQTPPPLSSNNRIESSSPPLCLPRLKRRDNQARKWNKEDITGGITLFGTPKSLAFRKDESTKLDLARSPCSPLVAAIERLNMASCFEDVAEMAD